MDVYERGVAFDFLDDIVKGVFAIDERSQQSGQTALERNTTILTEEENHIRLQYFYLEVAFEPRPADHGGPDFSTTVVASIPGRPRRSDIAARSYYIYDHAALILSDNHSSCHPEPTLLAKDPGSPETAATAKRASSSITLYGKNR
jgi:hypothetical protein